MKKLVLFLFCVSAAFAQQKQPVQSLQEDCGVTADFTTASSGAQAAGTTTAGSTGTTSVIDNRTAGCLDWLVTYSATSTVTGVSLLFQTASDVNGVPGTWANYPGTLTTGINPNTAATTPWAITEGTGTKLAFLRMNLTSKTGAGTVHVRLYGWKRRPTYVTVTSGGGCPGTVAVPCVVVGPGADGAAVVGFPVRIGGKDGSGNTQDVATDTLGNQNVVGPAADGAAVAGAPVRIGGKDGSGNTQDVATDTLGNQNVVGPAADGAAVAGAPVRIGGKDGSGNTQDVLTNTAGNIDPAGVATAQADGATNSPNVPSASGAATVQPVYPFKFNGSTWDKDFICPNRASVTLADGTVTKIVPESGSTVIRVCHIHMTTTTPETFTISQGTGAACVTGLTTIDKFISTQALAMDYQPTAALRASAAAGLCVSQSGTQAAEVTVIYAQF